MGLFSTSVLARLVSRLNLRYPTLFRLLVIVTALDYVIPDALPFLDEVGLTLATLLVSQLKTRRASPTPSAP